GRAAAPIPSQRYSKSVRLVETFERCIDFGFGIIAADPVGALHELARLEVLVMSEEVLDHVELEFRHVADVLVDLPTGVTGRNRKNLVVAAAFIRHLEHSDRT